MNGGPEQLKYFVLMHSAPSNREHNLETLNALLAEGWKPVREIAMGGGGMMCFEGQLAVSFASLILLKK